MRSGTGAGFGGKDLYPDVIDKAAVLCRHVVNNHGLPDGNKRCASVRDPRYVASSP